MNTTTTTIGLTAQQAHALNAISHKENALIFFAVIIMFMILIAAIGIGDAIEKLQKERTQ